MNNQRRKRLAESLRLLRQVEEIIGDVLEEEEEVLDNCPENLQSGDRYEAMENAVECLNTALDNTTDTIEIIEELI